DIYQNIAQTYQEMNKPEEAKNIYQIILDKYPNPDRDYGAKMNIISLKRQQNKREEAIKYYQALLGQYANSPERNADIYQNIAQTYQEMNKPEEAEKILEEFKKLRK
ncbi:MAG: tetratricopeptide repeat protein, partial [Candidatus Omnitrophica bacterium]|nr:tetratricopeptide repeat protein [Candidatus Omnitrophota bacterium]